MAPELSTPGVVVLVMLRRMDDDAQIQAAAIAAVSGDRRARAVCVELAYPRLRGLARRYEGRGVSREDLEQEVALGVMRAIERYDPARGVPFVAWAHTWVRQALQQAIAEQSRPFRLTRHALWDLHEAKTAEERLWQRDRTDPSLARLADALGWPQERVAYVLRSGQTQEHPDAVDLVDDPLSTEAFEDVITRITAAQIRPLLLALPERERAILDRRANDETLRTVGRSLGLSHQRVAALEERALSKVRVAAELERP